MSTDKPKRRDMRKGGRTKVCLTPEEYLKIQKMMKETGLSAQKLMKNALLSRTDLETPVFSIEDTNLHLAALKRIGRRINEIAIQANAGTLTNWSNKFASITADYVRLKMVLKGELPAEALEAIS